MTTKWVPMAPTLIRLYRSANGDNWFLEQDAQGALFVIHNPNLPSGGQRSRTPVPEFLERGSKGPEHHALLEALSQMKTPPLDEKSMDDVARDCPL